MNWCQPTSACTSMCSWVRAQNRSVPATVAWWITYAMLFYALRLAHSPLLASIFCWKLMIFALRTEFYVLGRSDHWLLNLPYFYFNNSASSRYVVFMPREFASNECHLLKAIKITVSKIVKIRQFGSSDDNLEFHSSIDRKCFDTFHRSFNEWLVWMRPNGIIRLKIIFRVFMAI